jgi:hypothetical protein
LADAVKGCLKGTIDGSMQGALAPTTRVLGVVGCLDPNEFLFFD